MPPSPTPLTPPTAQVGPLVRADGPGTTASATWSVWGTSARIVVTDPRHLDAAVRIVTGELAAVAGAASRFRDDSELMSLPAAGGRSQLVTVTQPHLTVTQPHLDGSGRNATAASWPLPTGSRQ